jgi:hypothetical protein
MMSARNKKLSLVGSILAATALIGVGATTMTANAADSKFVLADFMNNVVMGSADGLWQAVSFDVGPDGKETYAGPTTDAEWDALHKAMQALSDAGTQLQHLPAGFHVQDPSLKYETPPGDLEPDAVAALIGKESAAWTAHAEVLRVAAAQALKATETRDLKMLSDTSDSLDQICESCHLQFWYPSQAAAAAAEAAK